jgi:hypothetical protein
LGDSFIPQFDTEKSFFSSSDFQAFGHTLYLRYKKKDCGYYELYLYMKLGYKFSVGLFDAAEGSDHVTASFSSRLQPYPAPNGNWCGGRVKVTTVTDHTSEKLLTSEGALQIEAVV